MFYIHHTACISPQKSLFFPVEEDITEAVDNKLQAVEPLYENIPPAMLRRMGKAVRLGVGASLPLLKNSPKPAGIIIGTGNGGLEDCIKFLNQVIAYEEGTLTPTNFVQSTPNAIASQLGLLSNNKGYNITHVHRGLAFENAMLDAAMMIKENPGSTYLLGGVEEISTYNYNINYLGGWYKKESVSNKKLYGYTSAGSIAGEGAAAFLINDIKTNALGELRNLTTLHTTGREEVKDRLLAFLQDSLPAGEGIDLLLSGENGDSRISGFYETVEQTLGEPLPIARFKHLTGEFETVSALAVYMAGRILQDQTVPTYMLKNNKGAKSIKNILIYNTARGKQHSLILISKI